MLNAREAPWHDRGGRGFLCEFEGFGIDDALDFTQLGINLTLLGPGEPMAMYHRENDQEDFLVLEGEALLVIEGNERPLRRWDLVHCPAGTSHVLVGAGDGPCLVLAVGARDRSTGPDWGATRSMRPRFGTAQVSSGRRAIRRRPTPVSLGAD